MGIPFCSHPLQVPRRLQQVSHLCANMHPISSCGAPLLCGHPLCTGFGHSSQPASVVFDVLWTPHATKRSVTCANWETVK